MSGWRERLARMEGERLTAERLSANPSHADRPAPETEHDGHHAHVEGNATVCSCGIILGIFSFVPDPRYWSNDPAEVEAAREEEQAYLDSISCSICGMREVVAEKDWGK